MCLLLLCHGVPSLFLTLGSNNALGNRIKREKGTDAERKLVVARSNSDHPSRSDEIPRLGIVKRSSRERLKEREREREERLLKKSPGFQSTESAP